MHMLSEFFHRLSDLRGLITWGGYVVLAAIVFAETGLLVGFFLPGDSLLMTAGVIAGTTNLLDIVTLNALLIPMAIAGDFVGYQFGRRVGPALFRRKKSLLFRPEHLQRTKDFYDKHGARAIVIARFVPIVRTFAPIVAGIGEMPYRKFVMFNVLGALGWVLSMTLLGFTLGQKVAPKSMEKIVYLVIVVSVLPIVIEVLRSRGRKPEASEGAASGESRAGSSDGPSA